MAAGAAETRSARSPGAAAALAGVSVVALLYLFFLYQIYNDPGIRDLGFATAADVQRYSVLVFALLFAIMLIVRMKWYPAAVGAPAAAPSSGGAIQGPGAAVIPSAGGQRPRVSAEDPAARPGAPPSMSVPRVSAEDLKGGWKRYRFPAERTGGLYVDSDIVVDSGTEFSDSPDSPRGRLILRVRDEVARVCVRCDLMNHCHGKVAALITLEDMRGNSDCLSGLKRIANVKLDGIRRAKEAQAAAAEALAAPPQAPEAGPAPEAPPAEPAAESAPEVAPAEGARDKGESS
jgi:hypothetical protein